MTPARVAAVAGGAAAALMLAIQVVGAGLATSAAPSGLVSLQLAPDVRTAAAIVATWTGPLRTAALRAHALDLLLPLAYGTATAAAGLALARGRAAGRRSERLARGAGRAGVAAAVLDQVENAAMGVTLLAGPGRSSVAVTLGAAAGKWVLLGASLIGLALVRWGRFSRSAPGTRRRRASGPPR